MLNKNGSRNSLRGNLWEFASSWVWGGSSLWKTMERDGAGSEPAEMCRGQPARRILPEVLGFAACIHVDAPRGAAMHGGGKAGFQAMGLRPSGCRLGSGVWGWVEPAAPVALAGGRAVSGGCSAVPRGPCLPQGTCAQPGRHTPLPANRPSHALEHGGMENIPCSAAGGIRVRFPPHFSWMCSMRGSSCVPCPS